MFEYFSFASIELITTSLFCTIVSLYFFFYWVLTKDYAYWKDRNIPFMEPTIFFGNIKEQALRKKSNKCFVNKCYNTFKGHGYGGVFFLNSPAFYVCKPEFIEKILIEDFSNFHDRLSKEDNRYPITYTLSYCTGKRWKALRSKVAPSFSSGKVSGMFEQILSSTERVLRVLDNLIDFREPIEIENMTTSYATEVLASCMFGIEVSNVDQYRQLRESLDAIFNPTLIRYVIMVLGLVNLKLYNRLNLKRVPKRAMDSFTNLIKDIIVYREQKETKRDDVIQTILNLKFQDESRRNKPNTEEFLSESEDKKIDGTDESQQRENIFTETCISSLMFNFMTAGIKPTSVTITFALFEIAKSSTIQDTIQKEISDALGIHGKWSFEALKDMTYLDLVIQETLRMHNFNLALMRSVTSPYTLPGTSITLDKDMMVIIPVDGLHMDPEHYPSPEEFQPERWENNQYRASSVYLPFGHGPRICISIHLAVLTMKLFLARVLAQYRVTLAPRMKLPLELDEKVFYPQAKGGMWLTFSRIHDP